MPTPTLTEQATAALNKELTIEVNNQKLDAGVNVELPKQWTVGAFVQRVWANNDWLWGFRGNKKF